MLALSRDPRVEQQAVVRRVGSDSPKGRQVNVNKPKSRAACNLDTLRPRELHSRATRPRDRLDGNLWIGQGLCPKCIHTILPESSLHPLALVDHRLQGIRLRNEVSGSGQHMVAPRTGPWRRTCLSREKNRVAPSHAVAHLFCHLAGKTFGVTSGEKFSPDHAARGELVVVNLVRIVFI